MVTPLAPKNRFQNVTKTTFKTVWTLLLVQGNFLSHFIDSDSGDKVVSEKRETGLKQQFSTSFDCTHSKKSIYTVTQYLYVDTYHKLK